jgi:long-chain fatty acid transport protein
MTGSIKLDRDATMIDITRLPSLAYRLNDRLSFGAGLNVIYGQQEEKEAPRHPVFENDKILKLNTSEKGFGVDLGVFYELRTGTRLGVSYLSEVELQHNEISKTNNLAPLPVDGLSTADRQNQNPGLTLKMPQRVLMSGYHELNDRWAIMANLGWQDWSILNRFAMGTRLETDSENIRAVRSYEDTWHVALGCQYRLNYGMLLTGSAAYDSSLVKKENQAAETVIGDAYRFSFGGQYIWKEVLNLGLGYTFVWNTDHISNRSNSLLDVNLTSEENNNSLHIMGANLTLKF